MTVHRVAGDDRGGWVDLAADTFGQWAARVKPAAWWRAGRARHVASEHDSPAAAGRIDPRHRRKQGPGVGMQRCSVEHIGRGMLDDPPEVHHGHLVGQVFDHRQIVRDEEIREPELLTQFHEQVHHLRLDRHVERRHGLVEHEKLWLEHERPRDGDPLPLASGKLVRIATEGRRRQPGALEGPAHPLEPLGRRAEAMDYEPFFEDRPDRHPRVERAVGILKHDLHPPAQGRERRAVGGPHVGAGKPHAAAGRLDEPEDAPAHRRLAAAAFADEAERSSLGDREAHAIHRPHAADLPAHEALPHRKVRLQPRHGEQRLGAHAAPPAPGDRGAPSSPANGQRTKWPGENSSSMGGIAAHCGSRAKAHRG